MNINRYIFFLIIIFNFMNAQNKIVGVFNPVSKTFETEEKIYWIDFFENDVARIYKNGYVGLIDSTGTILCEPKYDQINLIGEKVYRVSLNNKYGLLDNKGNQILIPFTSELSNFNLGLATYTQQDDKYGHNLYGIIKSDGTFLTKAEYALLLPREGFGFLFTKNDQVGLIDYKGKEIIVYNKKDIKQAIMDNVIRIDQGIINKQENCSPKGSYHKDLLKFEEGLTTTFKKIGDCYKYGFMNKDFKTIITPQYDWVEEFKNGYAIISNKDKWGVVDVYGNQIITCKYTSIKQVDKDRFVVCSNNKFGVINNKNKIIIKIKYNSIFGLGDNLYATHDEKKWGVIDEKEKLILPFEFDGVTSGVATKYESQVSLPTGLIRQTLFGRAYKFDKLGKLDKEGIRFSVYVEGGHDFLFDPSFFLPFNNLSRLENENQIGKIDENIKKEKYDFIEKLKNDFTIVGIEEKDDLKSLQIFSEVNNNQKRYKKGIIDNNNQIIIPIIYDDIEYNKYNQINLFVSKLNGKYGVIDLKNNMIIPIEYDNVIIESGFFIVKKQIESYKWQSGVFDFLGKELIPFSTASYEIIGAGVLRKKDGEHQPYFIDKNGNKININ